MGDRCNYGFRTEGNEHTIYLYLHSGGHEMMANLADALVAAHNRWGEAGYATRIALNALLPTEGSTGGGVYVDEIVDNEHSIPVVDWAAQTVSLYAEGDHPRRGLPGNPKFTVNFPYFITKYSKTWEYVVPEVVTPPPVLKRKGY